MWPSVVNSCAVIAASNMNIKSSHTLNDLGYIVSYYPTTIIAALISLSVLGTGGAGCAAFAAFIGGGTLSSLGYCLANRMKNPLVKDISEKTLAYLFVAGNIVAAAGGIHLLISLPFSYLNLGASTLAGLLSVVSFAAITK
jgi:hypothetical protein